VSLNLSVTLLPINDAIEIDAFVFDHSHASKHYKGVANNVLLEDSTESDIALVASHSRIVLLLSRCTPGRKDRAAVLRFLR